MAPKSRYEHPQLACNVQPFHSNFECKIDDRNDWERNPLRIATENTRLEQNDNTYSTKYLSGQKVGDPEQTRENN
jgi:hypothetical protein